MKAFLTGIAQGKFLLTLRLKMLPLSFHSADLQTKSTARNVHKLDSFVDRRVIICLAILFYGLGAVLSQKRAFDQDEFLHVHAAWSMFKGLLPYRDYFDHYTPLFHLFLVPFFHFFKVETDMTEGLAFFFFARKLMWLISAVILLLTFWLGKLWRNTEIGLVAVLFWLSTETFWNTSLEVRPDPLATIFWLLYLVTFVRAIRANQEEHVRKRMFAWSGLFLALSFLAIQKLVYAFPGLAVGTCWYALSPRDYGTRRLRLVHVAYQLGGFSAPMIFTASYFYLHNGLTEFIRYNFLFYLGVGGFSPYHNLHQLLYQHPFLGFFGSAGLLSALPFIFRPSSLPHGDFIIVPATVALIVGLFLIPFPHYQYYVLFLPLVAVFAATFLVEWITKLADLRDRLTVSQWASIAALGSGAMLTGVVVIGRGAGSHWPVFLIVGYWFVVLLASMALIFMRARNVALVFFLIAMSVGPLMRLHNALASPDPTPQIDEIRYIMENTSPTETVMDGYQGSGVYRPHAYFFWFLTHNDRQGITEKDRQKLLEDLHTGAISPNLILFDENLKDLSPAITEFFQDHYEAVGTGFIWRRKPVPDGVIGVRATSSK